MAHSARALPAYLLVPIAKPEGFWGCSGLASSSQALAYSSARGGSLGGEIIRSLARERLSFSNHSSENLNDKLLYGTMLSLFVERWTELSTSGVNDFLFWPERLVEALRSELLVKGMILLSRPHFFFPPPDDLSYSSMVEPRDPLEALKV